jgi:hypothetical protein
LSAIALGNPICTTTLTADGRCHRLDWHKVVMEKEVTKGDRGGKGLEDERRLVLVPGRP